MRKFYKLLILVAITSSCQFGDDNIIIDPEFTLDGSSALTSNLKSLTQNSTTFDNFIDGTSKVRIELPYDLFINDSIEFRLAQEIDYQNLINVLEATPIEDDIDLVFPLRVTGIDHVEINVASGSNFEEVLNDLPESSEVNCLNIQYPIMVQYYSSATTQVSDESILSDAQLFNFLNNLFNEGIFYEIQYPIVATTADQSETIINSNSEFNAIYSDLPNFCLNTVIYDNLESSINPDDLNAFVNFITAGVFSINDFRIDENEVIEYESSFFTFGSEGEIFDESIIVGSWQVELDGNVLLLTLTFEDDSYDSLENQWYVMTQTENDFDLSFVNQAGIISKLTMEMN
jgi:hypothetical protein